MISVKCVFNVFFFKMNAVEVRSGESVNPLKRKSVAMSSEASMHCEDGRDMAEMIKDFIPRRFFYKKIKLGWILNFVV